MEKDSVFTSNDVRYPIAIIGDLKRDKISPTISRPHCDLIWFLSRNFVSLFHCYIFALQHGRRTKPSRTHCLGQPLSAKWVCFGFMRTNHIAGNHLNKTVYGPDWSDAQLWDLCVPCISKRFVSNLFRLPESVLPITGTLSKDYGGF